MFKTSLRAPAPGYVHQFTPGAGVVWSSEDAQGPQHQLQTANQGVPEARLCVFQAGSDTQDISTLGPLATRCIVMTRQGAESLGVGRCPPHHSWSPRLVSQMQRWGVPTGTGPADVTSRQTDR
eukprot:9361726-Pyramimonas_sp.AAC.1